MTLLFALLIVFQLKHFLADYPLQGKYMLGKFKDGWDWVIPLLAHSSVHFIFTLMICSIVNPSLWWLALVDFVIHFSMDRIKAGKNFLGRFKIEDKRFWWSLGFDQMVHHLTHYFVIWMLIK